MRLKKTKRGFKIGEFKDWNGVECSIQKSSIATEDCIWLGADDPGIKKFVPFGKPSSWQDIDLTEILGTREWVANTRMHLNRKQVRKLLPILQKFVETGDLD